MWPALVRIGSCALLFAGTVPHVSAAEVEPRLSWNAAIGEAWTLPVEEYADYAGGLSASAGLLKSAARHLSVGVEFGYQHLGSAFTGVQCGPEWGVECPGPKPKAIGLWSLSTIARWRAGLYRFHPYVLAGVGVYRTAEPSLTQFSIRHELEPGVTAGAGVYGFLPGGLGLEGRWRAVRNGDPEQHRAVLHLLDARITVNGP